MRKSSFDFLAMQEAADYMSISKSHLYKLTERRAIPFYRIGRRILFEAADLEEYLMSCRVEPPKDKKRPAGHGGKLRGATTESLPENERNGKHET